MGKIDLKEVMAIIQSGAWFSLRFLTADLNKNSGGKILHFPKARICRRKLLEESGSVTDSFTGISKSASHNQHFTVNLELPNGQIRKIHPILIYEIDNQKVL